eukprot:169841_1
MPSDDVYCVSNVKRSSKLTQVVFSDLQEVKDLISDLERELRNAINKMHHHMTLSSSSFYAPYMTLATLRIIHHCSFQIQIMLKRQTRYIHLSFPVILRRRYMSIFASIC